MQFQMILYLFKPLYVIFCKAFLFRIRNKILQFLDKLLTKNKQT